MSKRALVERFNKLLVGDKVKSIKPAEKADEGLLITFESGHTLEYKYSKDGGDTLLNGIVVTLWEDPDLEELDI